MAETAHSCWHDADNQAVREQLARIFASQQFRQSQRRQRFLDYVVGETLAGRGERLKAYTIAVEVFDRPETFDPLVDPLVRVEAGRLRDKLREYYESDGQDDPVHIELPKGHYVPVIALRALATPDSSPSRPDSVDSSNIHESIVAAHMSGQPANAHPSSAYGRKQLGALAAAALFTVVGAIWFSTGRDPQPPPSNKPSIAVLPFDNIGNDTKWERLADGITEDIISDLARFRNLVIIARNSTSVYKHKSFDIRQIGHDLNVRYVLEGSIQPMDERIRVTAQLIEAASGSHVWTERFDRPVDDLFAVQNELTQRIAATLGGYQGAIEEAERGLVRRKSPASLTAYDTYLLGMEMKHNVTKESLVEAEALFLKAIALDPQLARGYVGLTDVYFYLIDLGLTPSVEETRTKMLQAAKSAVQFDPNDGKTHLALGGAYILHGQQEKAAAALARAEALAPSDADVLLIIAWTIPGLGESQRALELAERALTLNPRYPPWYNQGLSYVFFFAEQYEKAVKYRLLVKEPLALDFAFLAMSYAYLNRTSEASAAAANVAKLDPAWNAERYLSDGGGYPEKEAELFVGGARKAGLSACVGADKLKDMPNFVHVRSCDAYRGKAPG